MKKLILFSFFAVIGLLVFAVYGRYSKNIAQVFPYPYLFTSNSPLEVKAPILITGDRLGLRLASFSDLMATEISQNLVKKIEIANFAKKEFGLHRTLNELKRLKTLPKVIIYLGGSEEFVESRITPKSTENFKKNFQRFQDLRVQTATMLMPSLSRLIYNPTQMIKFGDEIQKDETEYDDLSIMERNEYVFRMYNKELEDLIDYVQENNSILILITTPISPDVAPKKSCQGTLPSELVPLLKETQEFVKKRDYKQAYDKSRELTLMANSNANAHYMHAVISKNLGLNDEAVQSLSLAAAFDCVNWRGNPVFNQIIKQQAADKDVIVFDFNQMLADQWMEDAIYLDEIYPQNLYFEEMSRAIALKIKNILNL